MTSYVISPYPLASYTLQNDSEIHSYRHVCVDSSSLHIAEEYSIL